ncbi:ABC transporter permease [Agrococcus jejuensis]|uniref:ABC-type transport system, involved in lipoprotein release, permease component n=1 Tax=Agrococcus jejuensis TaxID=399736 RepID=A0A1G8FFN6_9MICO|nr:FtsX-like permease family protein [Agrococcus jejuensis]SDH80829.1 ABC-type transport system, involved in lipoprotein release, permease component [Agrococcus jejuensis]
MLLTYLRRELSTRRRQTITVAIGMAVAVALVIVVSALSAGFRSAQADALDGVYGVGTDLAVTATPAGPGSGEPGEGGPGFSFDDGAGTTDADGTTTLESEVLSVSRGTGTLDASTVDTVAATDGVAAATGVLSLEATSFSGQIMQPPTDVGTGTTDGTTAEGTAPTGMPEAPAGGEGFGPSSFDVASTTVDGVDPAATLGPLTATTLVDGRLLEASDAGALVAVVSDTYASTEEVAVGDTIALAGSDLEVVGIVTASGGASSTSADVTIPLDVAQSLSSQEGLVTSVVVQATDAGAISGLATDLQQALPDATVSTQEELASTVSGSLQSASSLMATLGLWLAVIVLAVAFALAALFTVQSVTRRTRELGTLKAIGWSNARIVRQIAAESLAQGLIGAVGGAILGVAACLVVTAIAPEPTLAGATDPATQGGPGGMGGMPDGLGAAAQAIALQAPVSLAIVAGAIGLAALGSVLAGLVGGWRAARLQPAVALRSVH